MSEKTFEYSPVFKAIYIAMLWFIPFLTWHYSQWLWHYVALMIFLGLGLRPLLEWSGLVVWFEDLLARLDYRLHRREIEKRRMLIARRERDRKYRHTHHKDPRLPRNW